MSALVVLLQQGFGDQAGMGVLPSGLGLGYDRGQYASGHGPPHGMLRQKSIGEAVCLICPPVRPPVCLSSGPAEVDAVLTCLSVAGNVSSLALYTCICSCVCYAPLCTPDCINTRIFVIFKQFR